MTLPPKLHKKISGMLISTGFLGLMAIGIIQGTLNHNSAPYRFFGIGTYLPLLFGSLFILGMMIVFPLQMVREYQDKRGVWNGIVRYSLYGWIIFGILMLILISTFFTRG